MSDKNELVETLREAADYFQRRYDAMIVELYHDAEKLDGEALKDRRQAIAREDAKARQTNDGFLLLHRRMAENLANTVESGRTERGVDWRISNDVAGNAASVILSLIRDDKNSPVLNKLKDIVLAEELNWLEFAKMKYQRSPHAYRESDYDMNKNMFEAEIMGQDELVELSIARMKAKSGARKPRPPKNAP